MLFGSNYGDILVYFLAFLAVVTVYKGVKIVPQQQAWIIERMGKFNRKLEPGLNILIPFIDRVAYKHSLKEQAIDVNSQTAITRDNVSLQIDGVLYVKITDAVAASYGVEHPYFAVTQLAQTSMRSEIGKMALDMAFQERTQLNSNIVESINEASDSWGIQCMRYEIKDITPPRSVLEAMELQVAAERQKRAEILDSEGKRQSAINIAEGEKAEVVLQSEAAMTDQINRAKGEAEAIIAVANATAEGIEKVASSIQAEGGSDAVSLRIAEQYVHAFHQLAKQGTTVLLPADTGNAGSMVAQALTVFESIKTSMNKKGH
ncbi:MAG: paraslipin [Rickettsiales bacterium]|nr:paraslipin [Rickettsiales bacterium]